jgi:UDP-N-acetylmuramoyl-tripeptide--D-alanyl-D-alanine ligase
MGGMTHSSHPQLTPEFVYRALGFSSTLQRGLHVDAAAFQNVTTDSRKIQPGCLFVAIPGDSFDGHDFIQQAIEKGARGILCRKGTAIPAQKGLFQFAVDDTVQAYRKLSAAWRKEFSIPVVVIAGAVGKTTTKELLSAVLRGRWPEVLRTQGSQNGFVGIPMTLLELRPEHGAAVIEVGIDEIGAMESHMQIVGAQASLLTAIAPEHLEKLIDLPTVAREEGIALTAVASQGGLVAINLDDPWIRPHFNTLRTGRKIGYSLAGAHKAASNGAHESILAAKISADGARLEIEGLGSFKLPLPGRHNAGNLLAAIAIAHGLGLAAAEIEKGLATFAGAEGRSELRELKTGGKATHVVCDYYNASPASMEAGFALLDDVAKHRHAPARRLALGDMLELGTGEESYHRGLAESILRHGFEQVLLYGTRMQWLHHELQNRGYRGALTHHASHDDLAKALTASARPGDAILIKGSRSMKMENVWKGLELGLKG